MKRWLLEGERVALGPLSEDLLPLYFQWELDPELRALTARAPGSVTGTAEHFFASLRSSPDEAHFTLHETLFQLQDTAPRAVGRACLHRVDYRHRTGELLVLVGDRSLWGQGIGTETTRLLLDWAFRAMDLQCVHARIPAFNTAALVVAERAGFRVAGRLRKAFRVDRTTHELVLFECLADEFVAPESGVKLLR